LTLLNNKFTKMLWFSLPLHLRNYFSSKLRYPGYIPPGWIDFGDLRRITPISNNFGNERGLPINRYYIEKFFDEYSDDIKGEVLEIGDDRYTVKFGEDKVTKSDILNLYKESNPNTTIEADITSAPEIPSNTFDCVIFTETLQLIYDFRSALETLERILKPDGVLFAVFPGISEYDRLWGENWCWKFTSTSAERLFNEFFHSENVEVTSYGNVLVALSFIMGIATQELSKDELDFKDPQYECLIIVRAQKQT
jgi:SAM-dependent methyltransferase